MLGPWIDNTDSELGQCANTVSAQLTVNDSGILEYYTHQIRKQWVACFPPTLAEHRLSAVAAGVSMSKSAVFTSI